MMVIKIKKTIPVRQSVSPFVCPIVITEITWSSDYDQTWLGVRCHPEWEFRPLFFHIHVARLFRGQNQPVDQVTAAALPEYGQKCT